MAIMRILTLALALVLAFPAAGLTEERYGSLTLSNFHFELGKEKPVDVNASVRAGYGGRLPDGPARLDIEVIGGGKVAFSGTASVQDGTLRALLEKSKYFFQVPMAGFEEALFGEAQVEARYAPLRMYSFGLNPYDYGYNYDDPYGQQPMDREDVHKLFELLGQYLELLKRDAQGDASKEMTRKILQQLNPEAKGVESVKVFGKSMKLHRFDLTLEAKDFQKYTDAFHAAAPEYKALEDEIEALLDKMEEGDRADVEKDDMDDEDEDPAQQALEETGIEKIACTFWSDTEVPGDPGSKVYKESYLVTVKDAVDEFGMPVTLEVPFTIVSQQGEKGDRLSAELTARPYKGESYRISFDGTFDAPGKKGGLSSSFKMKVDIDSEEDGVVIEAEVTGSKVQDADGVVSLDAGAKGKLNGQSFDIGFSYEGETATQSETSGTVTFAYDFPSGATKDGGMPSKALIRFDALAKSGALEPLEASAWEGLQPVNPLRASGKAMDKVSGDMYGALMQGVGVLMQTKGLSGIIGGLMNAA